MNSELTIRGRSLGGIYTSVFVPEFGLMFDAGVALRENVGARGICLSHGHADHVGALPAFLGMRGLFGHHKPLSIYCPRAIEAELSEALKAFQILQTHDLNAVLVPMDAGDTVSIGPRLQLRAFKTYHPVPSLGYAVFESVKKLRPEFRGLPGEQIRALKQTDQPIFDVIERPYFAYATDTLPEVLKHEPWLLTVPELMIECTFLDERKTLRDARRGGHVHLDELLPYLATAQNRKIHLMHFSQLYQPDEIRARLLERLPEDVHSRVQPLLPKADVWWH